MDNLPDGTDLMKLNNANLERLPEGVKRPTYDRSALKAGIVHIGVGNFHRAHQAWYLHSLMQLGEAHDWAIIGAGVRAYDSNMRERLLEQDCMTTLIELAPNSSSVEDIGSMIDYLPIAEDNGPLIARMAQADTKPLKTYGDALGLAFQIADDILDIEGDAATVGKAVGKDAEAGKATFVSLLGLDAAKRRAQALVEEACDALSPYGNDAETLRDAARYVITRDK